MIEVQLPNIKFNFWKSSDQRLFDLALAGIRLHQVRCPKCGAIGCCTPFKSYQRMMITTSGGRRINTWVVVPRVRCSSCGHTHALIPENLIPYGSYSIRFVFTILLSYLHRHSSVSEFCDHWQISISTLYGWIHLFSRHYSLLADVFHRIHWVTEQALHELMKTPDFLDRFFRQFRFAFLQASFVTPSRQTVPGSGFSPGPGT